MSVGGKVVQVYHYHDLEDGRSKVWVNTLDHGEYCAVILDGTRNVREGDTIWWQSNKVFWSRIARDEFDSSFEEEITRLSSSGVVHPLGKEFQVVYDFHDAYTKVKKERDDLKKEMEELKKELEKKNDALMTVHADGSFTASKKVTNAIKSWLM